MKMARQKFPCVLRNVLIIISNTTDLSFMLKRIGPLAAINIALSYLLALYLCVTIKTHKNPSVSVCSETLRESTNQHLLLLVGFDTLIYRKYCDRSPILVGHHSFRKPFKYNSMKH